MNTFTDPPPLLEKAAQIKTPALSILFLLLLLLGGALEMVE